MKVLHLNQRDDGGAGRAMLRLHQGLRMASIDSVAFVQVKTTSDPFIHEPESLLGKLSAKLKLAEHLSNLPLKSYPHRPQVHFSPSLAPDSLASVVDQLNPDIVHLHWINHGLLRIETLKKFKRPIVWTLHDMWPFTGGCHYSNTCDRYTQSCGACPALGSNQINDLSHKIWKRKSKAWQDIDLTIAAPSKWMAGCARESSLFGHRRIEVISNGISREAFKPVDTATARRLLNLPSDKHLVLFGAANVQDVRKGMHLLMPALQQLHARHLADKLELLVFGAAASLPAVDFKVHYLGRLADDISLALAYSAADVFVAPSVEDNLPNTLVESLACGTPGVAFDIGGMADIIDHTRNGYLAKPFDPESLAEGIRWVVEHELKHTLASHAAQKAGDTFDLHTQSRRYVALYRQCLGFEPSAAPNLPVTQTLFSSQPGTNLRAKPETPGSQSGEA